ncbi:MAG: stage II sporulation protein R [Oscillospiraceae bacterium]|nr:stage II sporulation protein R [Oscillospiraceae bacterium]
MLKKEKGRLSLQKWELFLLTAMVLAAVFSSLTAFSLRCREIRESTLRLHILASSDSEFDQQVKLSVRDGILNDTAELFSRCATRSQLERQAERELPRIEASARETLRRLGVEEPVKAELATMFFDTRVYNDVVMPAGRYRAVRVTLGEGKGKNWWCVLFPPLCLPAAQTGEFSEEASGADEMLLREEEGRPKYKMRLAVVEWAQELREKWEKEP